MKEKLEFSCECGRKYIVMGDPSEQKERKCARCGRIMKNVNEQEEVQEEVVSFEEKAMQSKNPFDYLQETWEYSYKPSKKEREQRLAKSSLKRLIEKVFSLFSIGKKTGRH